MNIMRLDHFIDVFFWFFSHENRVVKSNLISGWLSMILPPPHAQKDVEQARDAQDWSVDVVRETEHGVSVTPR